MYELEEILLYFCQMYFIFHVNVFNLTTTGGDLEAERGDQAVSRPGDTEEADLECQVTS